jgi:GDSL-like lipase/acylhydrolase family protein
VRRALAVAALLALCAFAGCGGTERTHSRNERVLIVGDSNVFNSTNAIHDDLSDAGFEPIVHGYPGFGLADFDRYWNVVLRELLEEDPAIVVVALGTNDTVSAAALEQVPGRIDQMMGRIGDREVIWITVANFRPGGVTPTAGAEVNKDLLAAAARWKNLTLLDWAAVIEADPSVLAPDRLHWSPRGRQRYAAMIRGAVVDVFDLSGRASPARRRAGAAPR